MRVAHLSLLIVTMFAAVSCGTRQEREEAQYLAAIRTRDEGYFTSDPNRAYQAEIQFIHFVEQNQKIGAFLPNPNVLVWEYPRLGLLAEYCGRKEESARLFAQAEQYARAVYPNEPPAKTTAAALHTAIELITTGEHVPWKPVPIKNQVQK